MNLRAIIGGVRTQTVPGTRNIAYSGRPMVFRKYTLLSPNNTQLQDWLKQVDHIYSLLKHKDLTTLKNFMGPSKSMLYLGNTENVLIQDLNDNDLRLMAIGLFFQKNKHPYRGPVKGYSKMLVGGTFTMESYFDAAGDPNCIDSAYLFKEIAGNYGIGGSVVKTGLRPFPPKHFYFKTDKGKVLDVMVKPGIRRMGLFHSEFEYLRRVRRIRFARYHARERPTIQERIGH